MHNRGHPTFTWNALMPRSSLAQPTVPGRPDCRLRAAARGTPRTTAVNDMGHPPHDNRARCANTPIAQHDSMLDTARHIRTTVCPALPLKEMGYERRRRRGECFSATRRISIGTTRS